MLRSLLTLVLLLQAPTSTLEGVVTKPGGAEPLAGARVALERAIAAPVPELTQPVHSAVTDDDGRFALQGVEPGDYRLVVDSARYGRSGYGQRHPGGPGSIVSVGAGEHRTGLNMSMVPTGAVTGRIAAANGEPLVRASVQALKYAYQNGRRNLVPVQNAMTDDRGEYRLFWLPPGEYFVAAAMNSDDLVYKMQGFTPPAAVPRSPGGPLGSISIGNVPPPVAAALFSSLAEGFLTARIVRRILDDGTVQEESWQPVYYPGALEPQFAVLLDVMPSATTSGVDIVIGPTPVRRIRGRVLGLNRVGVPQATLLSQNNLLPTRMSAGVSIADGSFEFRGVRPGSYFLAAHDMSNGLVATPVPVEIGDRDLDGLTVTLTPGITLTGRVVLENERLSPGDPRSLSGVNVILTPDAAESLQRPVPGPPVDPATGVFALSNVAPGTYQIQLLRPTIGNAGPLHIRSVMFGFSDATEGIHVTAGSQGPIEIVLTSESASAQGTVMDAAGRPAANVTVALVPNTGRRRMHLYHSTTTGAFGGFRFVGVAPGDYKLFAWEDVEPGAWQDPDFLKLHEAKGRVVRLSGNSREDVQLVVIEAQ